MRRLRLTGFTLILVLATSSASAQESGVRVAGFFGGAFGEGNSSIATGGSVGYRFTPRFGFDFEVLAMPNMDLDRRPFGGLPTGWPWDDGAMAPWSSLGTSTDTYAFLTNFVAEFPSQTRWLIPYISGGGGVASVSRTTDFGDLLDGITLPGFPDWMPGMGMDLGFGGLFGPMRLTQTETDLALTVGGGVDFQLTRGFAVGADLRYLHLFGTQRGLDLFRVAGRAVYRF